MARSGADRRVDMVEAGRSGMDEAISACFYAGRSKQQLQADIDFYKRDMAIHRRNTRRVAICQDGIDKSEAELRSRE